MSHERRCLNCDGKGWLVVEEVHCDWGGPVVSMIQNEIDCETCNGSGSVPILCPECGDEHTATDRHWSCRAAIRAGKAMARKNSVMNESGTPFISRAVRASRHMVWAKRWAALYDKIENFA